MKKVSAIVVLAVMTLLACNSEPTFELVPKITFKDIKTFALAGGTGVGQGPRDSVVIALNFQDGDGDLGVNQNDSGRYSKDVRKTPNYLLKVFYQLNGRFQEVDFGESYTNLFFQPLRTDGRVGPIEGTLEYSLSLDYNNVPPAMIPILQRRNRRPLAFRKDTLKFQVSIKDRTLRQSNVIETTQIIVNNK
jgi:hypothetical protein